MFISLLLRKALPFALTFVVGTALGGLTWLFGGSEKKTETTTRARVTRVYDYGSRCRMRGHKLVAETKALVILSQPKAHYQPLAGRTVRVNVKFGADGRVQGVEHLQPLLPESVLESVERAAWQIQFTPELVNSLPVAVEREVEIRVASE